MTRRLKGSAELEARLKAIPREILQELRPALLTGAHEIADAAEELVPEDEGDLLNSINVTAPGDETPAYAAGGGKRTANENQAFVTVGSEDVRYGHIPEFGSVKQAATPYLRPAFRLKKDRVTRRIARAVSKAIKRNGGK